MTSADFDIPCLSQMIGLMRQFDDVERALHQMDIWLMRQWGDKDEERVASVNKTYKRELVRFHELDTVLACYRAENPDLFQMAEKIVRESRS